MNNDLDTCISKQLTAVCGLFCPACTFFIGTMEYPKRLKKMALRLQLPVSELKCHGCRSDKLAFFCRKQCKMIKCEIEKDIDFCNECKVYPCLELKAFQSRMPHRNEIWKSQKRIMEVGYEKWFEEMIEHYSCSKCHTINSPYDISCRNCGTTPSCNYVKLHQNDIIQRSSKLKL